jgi:hypothetical protein
MTPPSAFGSIHVAQNRGARLHNAGYRKWLGMARPPADELRSCDVTTHHPSARADREDKRIAKRGGEGTRSKIEMVLDY